MRPVSAKHSRVANERISVSPEFRLGMKDEVGAKHWKRLIKEKLVTSPTEAGVERVTQAKWHHGTRMPLYHSNAAYDSVQRAEWSIATYSVLVASHFLRQVQP